MEIEIVGVGLPEVTIGRSDDIVIDVTKPDGGLPPGYDGVYEVTPSDEEQRLPTKNRLTKNDIIVKPIPSNYGKVSYNGAVLMIE